jgi:zinc protease
MVITIVGEVPSWKEEIKKQFTFRSKKEKKISLKPALTTILQKSMVKKEQRKVVNTYIIMGFRTVPAIHPDAAALEVINGIVGRGQSGRMFAEIRGKRGLAYDVGTQNVAESSFGYFAIYASINRKNVTTVKSLIMQELDKLSRVSQADLREAIEYIEGNFYLGTEDAQKLADQILFWEQMENAALLDTFIARIKKVTISDIKRVVKKYFNRHVFVILEGK